MDAQVGLAPRAAGVRHKRLFILPGGFLVDAYHLTPPTETHDLKVLLAEKDYRGLRTYSVHKEIIGNYSAYFRAACTASSWKVGPRGHVPVKIFWNASSTLLASRAVISPRVRTLR